MRLAGHKLELSRSGVQSLNVIAHCKCGWSHRLNRTVESARISYRSHLELELLRLEKAIAKAARGAA